MSAKYFEVAEHFTKNKIEREKLVSKCKSLAKDLEGRVKNYFSYNDEDGEEFVTVNNLHNFNNDSFDATLCLTFEYDVKSRTGDSSHKTCKYEFTYMLDSSFRYKEQAFKNSLEFLNFIHEILLKDESF